MGLVGPGRALWKRLRLWRLSACLPAWGSGRAAGCLGRACTHGQAHHHHHCGGNNGLEASVASSPSASITLPTIHPALTAHLPASPYTWPPYTQLAEFVSCPVLAAAINTHVEAGVEEHAGGRVWRTRRTEEEQALRIESA